MTIKGRYVGQIEIDVQIDTDKTAMESFQIKEYLSGVGDKIDSHISTLIEDKFGFSGAVKIKHKLTRQYFDMYEVEN